ncbi:hypothetical protein [Yersinia enterocolitica]|uniref:hypothetical protein n=1 Tax=Yersinia enterocolitica TaxID=630 RepID=UPI003CFC8F39
MNEKPILFNSEMVNAILSGRKTMTRRIMKVQPAECNHTHWPEYPNPEWKLYDRGWNCAVCGNGVSLTERDVTGIICPLGKPGDQLWVREAFAAGLCTESTLAYRATHKPEDLEEGWGETIKWTPSIHMPRWASRINLLITGVRVERLNTISTGDAMAEGYPVEREATGGSLDAWLWFRELWDGIYPDNTFEVNPWCWVIEFERMEAK